MIWPLNPPPERFPSPGDRRTRTFFAWLPVDLDLRYYGPSRVWLELVEVTEVLRDFDDPEGPRWVPVEYAIRYPSKEYPPVPMPPPDAYHPLEYDNWGAEGGRTLRTEPDDR